MSELRAFQKPSEIEGIVTLTPKQKAVKRRCLFDLQCGVCACGCGRPMSWSVGQMDSATLEHITPRPAGCKKQDADFNLQCFRFDCNSNKGSRRPSKLRQQVTVIQ